MANNLFVTIKECKEKLIPFSLEDDKKEKTAYYIDMKNDLTHVLIEIDDKDEVNKIKNLIKNK